MIAEAVHGIEMTEDDILHILELSNEYIKTFPNAPTPNYWECGSWEAVQEAVEKALKSGKPWISSTPKDAIL